MQFIAHTFNNLLSFIYPPRCLVCDILLPAFKDYTRCSSCSNILVSMEAPFCICGLPKNNCKGCGPHSFSTNRSAFLYNGIIQDVIYKFKYGKKPFMAKGLVSLMVKEIGSEIFQNADIIAPIPIHKKRQRTRGFNQSALLAKEITNQLNLPPPKTILFRIKETKPLAGLTPLMRANILKDAFIINPKITVANKTILLIDDIYTTGATLNACAKHLYENGAKDVLGATIAVVETKSRS